MSPVPGDDGSGGGQADAVAAGGAVPGGVSPIEAVEVAGELGGVHPLAGIGDQEIEIPPPLRYLQTDGPAGVTVFDRVVQKNGEQTENFSLS